MAEQDKTASGSNAEIETKIGDGIDNNAVFEGMQCAVDDAAELLRSLGSPYRLLILCMLMEDEKTVSEICDGIGARQSLTSQHLTRLRLDGLVSAERRGHFVYYTIGDTVAKDIVGTLYNHYCAMGRTTKCKS